MARTALRSSADQSYRAANVLLAIGRRGTRASSECPGEEYSKVVYRLIDPGNTAARTCWWSAVATAPWRPP